MATRNAEERRLHEREFLEEEYGSRDRSLCLLCVALLSGNKVGRRCGWWKGKSYGPVPRTESREEDDEEEDRLRR